MADPLLTIDSGENLLLTVTIQDENGDAVNLADVSWAEFYLVGEKPAKQLKAWRFEGPDNTSEDIAIGTDDGELILELLPEETATHGTYRLITKAAFSDASYISSETQVDVVETLDFLKINEVGEYGIALVPAEVLTEDYDDLWADDDGTIIVDDDGTQLAA